MPPCVSVRLLLLVVVLLLFGAQTLGIPNGLPELSVAFFGLRVHHGAQFFKTQDVFLQGNTPVATWGDDGNLYTLLLVDPDAPHPHADCSKPGERGPWLHWFIKDCRNGTSVGGDECVEYEGPAPPKGNHRYIFVLFRQNGEIRVPTEERKAWPFEQFLKLNQHLLTPVAMNYFFTEAQ